MNKNELRKKIRQNKLSREYILEAGELIAETVLSMPEFIEAESVFCYLSADNEPSTDRIIEEALKDKAVYVPKCLNDGEMVAVKINADTYLQRNAYGILEPVVVSETAISFDLIIIPCMAAGVKGERLGHGKGYYDRFLEYSKGKIVCLCFENNIRDDIEMTENDIWMPCIITENNNYGNILR